MKQDSPVETSQNNMFIAVNREGYIGVKHIPVQWSQSAKPQPRNLIEFVKNICSPVKTRFIPNLK